MAEAVLRVEGLGLDDGATARVQALSFRLEPATLAALIGPDDTDKNALVDALTGCVPVDRGTLLFGGRPITHWLAAARVHAGLVATSRSPAAPPAGRALEATVLAMAGRRRAWRSSWWRRRATPTQAAAAADILRFVGLGERQEAAPSTLDALEVRRLELARALALGPRLLLVDRLTRGLGAMERAMLAALLVQVAKGGIAVLWVEDDVELVGEVAEMAFVLVGGRLVAGGPIDILAHSRTAELAFLGEPS